LFIIEGALKPVLDCVEYFWRDTHPAIFPILATVWTRWIGDSELAVRTLPAILGVLAVLVTFTAYRGIVGFRTALLVAGLTCVLPIHIYYSQEFRNYILAFSFVVLVTAGLLQYIDDQGKRNRWLFAIPCGLLLGTHYLGVFYVACAWLIASVVLGFPRRVSREFWRLSGSVLLATCVYMPHLVIARARMSEFWPPPVNIEQIGKTLVAPFRVQALAYAYLAFAAAGVGLAVRRREHVGRVFALLVLSILPLCGTIAVSLMSSKVSILIPNRVAFLFVPPFLLLAGLGLSSIATGRRPAWWAGLMGFAILAGLSVWVLGDTRYYAVPTKHPCRETIGLVAQLEHGSDDPYLVSMDRLYIVHWAYPYYIRKFGLKARIHSRSSEDRLASLDEVVRKARQAGKRRLVLFQAAKYKSNELVSEADRRFERLLIVSQIAPAGGMLLMYALDQPKEPAGEGL
jgi:uncharacterized membrane protein